MAYYKDSGRDTIRREGGKGEERRGEGGREREREAITYKKSDSIYTVDCEMIYAVV